MDERDAELCAHQGELSGAVVGAVVDIEALGDAAADEGVGEHGEEGLDVLRGGEGGEGDDTGGVVDEGDEVALSPRSAVTDLRPVHDIAHPQLAGVAEGEAAAVGAVVGLGIEQALAMEQPVHGGGGEGVVDAFVAGGADDGAYRPGGIVDLERDETRGELGGAHAFSGDSGLIGSD